MHWGHQFRLLLHYAVTALGQIPSRRPRIGSIATAAACILFTGCAAEEPPHYPTYDPRGVGSPATGRVDEPFPWPPPEAATLVLPRSLTNRGTYGDIDSMLVQALRAKGYGEIRYADIPGGFALISKLERIQPDGSPVQAENRWGANDANASVSLLDILKGLFIAPRGYFRLLVFVVTDTPFEQSSGRATSEHASSWLRRGKNQLEINLEEKRATPQTSCTVLVYEFRSQGFSTRAELQPATYGVQHHLEKAGIWPALSRGRS